MTELKPCPFRGSEPYVKYDYVKCRNRNCMLSGYSYSVERWNKRVSPWKTIEEEMPPMNTLIIANFNFMGKENSILRFGKIVKHDEEIIELEMKKTFFEEVRTGFAFDSEWIKKWMPIPE